MRRRAVRVATILGYLGARPLIAYTIAAARESGVFNAVLVSTDSPAIAEVARHYGAEVPFLRPTSPFRQVATIRRAWGEFLGETGIDSLRAVEKCAQHHSLRVRGPRRSFPPYRARVCSLDEFVYPAERDTPGASRRSARPLRAAGGR